MPISYLTRRNKIRKDVAQQRINALLVTNPVNVRYLTGFTGGGAAWLLIRKEGDVIFSDSRFTIQIEEECPGLEAVIHQQGVSLTKTLAKTLGSKTTRKLGIEAEFVTLAEQERLLQAIFDWEIVPTKNIVEDHRQIKDRQEIDDIRRAISIARQAFLWTREWIQEKHQPDLTEIQIRNSLEYQMRLLGAEDKSFSSIVGAGARAALPHGIPSEQTLAGQSHLLIDWGCIVNGYMSDLTRVLILDTKDKKMRTVYDTVLAANEAAIAAVKPGKTCEEIDAVARNVIKDAGFGKYFAHGLGHAVGLEIHENPRFAIGHQTVLQPGMVMTIEPGIYLKGRGGVRIEDDILITKTGYELLSSNVPKSYDEMVL